MAIVPAMADNINKLSASTQMFLSERKGEVKLLKLGEKKFVEPSSPNDSMRLLVDDMILSQPLERQIADVELVDGVEMISAFVTVSNGSFSSVEKLGAVMQTEFKDGLAAMLLPADRIEEIADLENVTGIEVAEILQPDNDLQRSFTQAGDAITNSAAAQALGLTTEYTGKGVILGIIDTGVDFQHIAFKDKNGNSRIVRAYMLSSSYSTNLTTYSTATQINNLTTDNNTGDHGTHTSTTAGGSSVIVEGNNVTVTDDHANATYGGMAPEADLVIAALSSLYTTSLGTAIENICNYADQVGKPCVISLSLGTAYGAHDGTGALANIIEQKAGDNHIIVFSASNNGMRASYYENLGTSNGGGMYASGTSTKSKPILVNVQRSFSDADGNFQLARPTIVAYARTPNVQLALKFHVVNVHTGEIVYSSNEYTSSLTIDLSGSSGLAQYYYSKSTWYNNYSSPDYARIRIIKGQDSNNGKYYWYIYAPTMETRSADTSGEVYTSDYAFCVSIYPTSNTSSTIVDMWESSYCWFGRDLTLSSSNESKYNLVQGNDDCSVNVHACYDKVISVGAYVSKNSFANYEGTINSFSSTYPNIGDHAYFSSWQAEGCGPLGNPLPTISAPGARIVAGVNHYHTTAVDDYSYYADDNKADLVVNSSTSPYGAMEGTSMSTPCASGIIAQWLQACVEVGRTPNPNYIKEVMAATWDTDEWTEGTNSDGHGAKTFGTHGKINAIKGIKYILRGDVHDVTLAELIASGDTKSTYNITDLRAVGFSDNGQVLICKDDNGYANKDVCDNEDYVDLMHTASLTNGLTSPIPSTYDQSNWIGLRLPEGATASANLLKHQLKGVVGKLTNTVNPEFVLEKVPESYGQELQFTPNLYIAASFNSTNPQISEVNGKQYFFVRPKPMEIANIEWAQWDGERFITPVHDEQHQSWNQAELTGGFEFNGSLLEQGGVFLETGHCYEMLPAIIRMNDNNYEHLYVLGNVNGLNPGYWSPAKGVEMSTKDGKVFTTTLTVDNSGDGYGYFSFTKKLDPDWDVIHDYRIGADPRNLNSSGNYYGDYPINDGNLGQALPLVENWKDIYSFKIAAGKYKFVVTLDGDTKTLVVTNATLRTFDKADNGFVVYPMAINRVTEEENGVITAVDNLQLGKNVTRITYYNALGIASDTPFQGVNIVVTRYSDGSTTTTKILK